MSIVGGLVQAQSKSVLINGHQQAVEDWLMRHSWGIVLSGTMTFWAVVAMAIYLA